MGVHGPFLLPRNKKSKDFNQAKDFTEENSKKKDGFDFGREKGFQI